MVCHGHYEISVAVCQVWSRGTPHLDREDQVAGRTPGPPVGPGNPEPLTVVGAGGQLDPVPSCVTQSQRHACGERGLLRGELEDRLGVCRRGWAGPVAALARGACAAGRVGAAACGARGAGQAMVVVGATLGVVQYL